MRTRSTQSSEDSLPLKSEEPSLKNIAQSAPLRSQRKRSKDKSDEFEAPDSMSPDYPSAKSIDGDVINDADNERETAPEDKGTQGQESLLLDAGSDTLSEDATRASDSAVASNDDHVIETASGENEVEQQQPKPAGSSAEEEATATSEDSVKDVAEKESTENVEDFDRQEDRSETPSETAVSSSVVPFPVAMPPFPVNPACDFMGQLQTEFAKNFYNSLSLLASQAMTGVKQEPREQGCQDYGTSVNDSARPSDNQLQIPPRNDSRSSDASGRSFDGCYKDQSGSTRLSDSLTPSRGLDRLSLPLSHGMSPDSLAAQLRNNDSASMVVSRQHKLAGRNRVLGYPQAPYSHSEGGTPSPVFVPVRGSSPGANGFPIASGGHVTSSPSLHHFTTRYTIETPADPSRLGVELSLDHYNGEPVIEVECGGNRGLLYVNKLCQGSKGQSIHFNDEWLTPNEFQFISGRETAKDWKRSIRHCGKSLKTLMTKGILQVHPPVCECSQCRGLHSGSKLLAGKKTPQKDDNNNNFPKRIKSAADFAFTSAGSHSQADEMARHGFDSGGLSAIISHLRKSQGFESNEAPETLDLSSNAQDRNETSSPESSTRKRSRNESPEPKKPKEEPGGDRMSPAAKRPYSRQTDRSQDSLEAASFAASREFLSPEEQYRHMIALMSRSISPGEQQRQFLSFAQQLADPLGMTPGGFGDFPGFLASLHPNAVFDERSKSKHKSRECVEDAFDLSRKASRRQNYDSSSKRSGHGFFPAEKYRKPDHRRAPTPGGRSDQKYIALESRHREDRPNHVPRDDVRSWTASRHAAMIDLNSSGSGHAGVPPDWAPKLPWPLERNQMSGKRQDVKVSPKRNGHSSGYFQDNISLERVPISKTPVTTLHHRPQEGDSRRRLPGEGHRSSRRSDNDVGTTPMLDLQKHAVPMLSLKRPADAQSPFSQSDHRSLGKQLSDNSDQEMKDINEDGRSIRQSSSAPPPHLSPREAAREARRPTSAQDRLPFGMALGPPRNGATASSKRPTSSSFGDLGEAAHYESYLQRRNNETQDALDRMRKWSVADVCNFITEIDPNLADRMEDFRKHEVDGEGLPLLTVHHLTNITDIKLGRALKIVARVKRYLKVLPQSMLCCSNPIFSPAAKKTPATNAKTDESSAQSSKQSENESENTVPASGDTENEKEMS